MPTGKVVGSRLGYWIRQHSMNKDDWELFVRFAGKHFGRPDSPFYGQGAGEAE